jgi:hypothetical protein
VAQRTLQDMRGQNPGAATLRNLASLLDTLCQLRGRMPLYEYEATEDGFEEVAEAVAAAARDLDVQIANLLALMNRSSPGLVATPDEATRRFR